MKYYEIVNNRGHYEIYFKGKFISSEDTYSEAENAIEEYTLSNPDLNKLLGDE